MVWLHMVYDEVIGLSAAERFAHVIKPLFAEVRVCRIEYGNLFVNYYVRVVRNSVGHLIHTLEEVD